MGEPELRPMHVTRDNVKLCNCGKVSGPYQQLGCAGPNEEFIVSLHVSPLCGGLVIQARHTDTVNELHQKQLGIKDQTIHEQQQLIEVMGQRLTLLQSPRKWYKVWRG